jgi:hypothetical protein
LDITLSLPRGEQKSENRGNQNSHAAISHRNPDCLPCVGALANKGA